MEQVRSTLKDALANIVSKEHALVFSCIAASAVANLHFVSLVHQDPKQAKVPVEWPVAIDVVALSILRCSQFSSQTFFFS